MDIDRFIDRWKPSGGSERANYQLFLAELCDLLAVERPDPAQPDNMENAYVFERSLRFTNADGQVATNFIDLYKRGCFVCETKQGVEERGGENMLSESMNQVAKAQKLGHGKRDTPAWHRTMKKARGQGERYIRSLPSAEGRPPFLLVVDVGYVIELYSEFTRTGGHYTPYPDTRGYRIKLDDLRDAHVRERLRTIWTDPQSLDPARVSARITREIATRLGKLAQSLEKDGHEPDFVAAFLMRCLFTMFSEDVGLLPKRSFTEMLESFRGSLDYVKPALEQLWHTMNVGGPSVQLREKLVRFNGGLFHDNTAIALSSDQLELLIESSHADWTNVEPAIFGTLLERALEPTERHKLGAHYTPREYVERLVLPTIVQPLREDWANIEAAATQLENVGETNKAIMMVEDFLKRLTQIRVLDPACGSGNFLYITLEHLKRLEGEVLESLAGFGATQGSLETEGITVDPHQLLGLEINPRAVAIADIVLWIGYLQWHFRTHGNVLPPEPVLKNFHNIQHKDALIEWDAVEPVLNANGEPVTHWDGRTTKPHPVTGKEVPDETARLPEKRYIGVRKASWPDADFIIGNPPFIGSKRMRHDLGDGYVDAIQGAWPELSQSSDFVLRWWHAAAELVSAGRVRRFGFITTNSIGQTYNRRALEPHLVCKNPVSIVWAVKDHPWVDASEGAAVRISMTVVASGQQTGRLLTITHEKETKQEARAITLEGSDGEISAALTIGAKLTSAKRLAANSDLCAVGMKTIGAGFQIDQEKAHSLWAKDGESARQRIRRYVNGREFTGTPRNVYMIDCFGLLEAEVRNEMPATYQHLLDEVRPARMENRNKAFRNLWWVIGHPREIYRNFTAGLDRYIVTIETSKHRVFGFLGSEIAPDSTLVTFGLNAGWYLGVLSSRHHVLWSLRMGGRLGVGNDPRYNKTRCFETFPFPSICEDSKQKIGFLAEHIDRHRKRQLEAHDKLTLTGIYNVLEKLRAGEPLTQKEKTIHEQGLVAVLKELHDELDAAVAEAYGWPADLSDDEILEKLLALNLERAAEERAGKIRWLRPKYQNPDGKDPSTQAEIAVAAQENAKKATKPKLPTDLPGRFAAVRSVLAELPEGGDTYAITAHFKNARRKTVNEILETLVGLGQISQNEKGVYTC